MNGLSEGATLGILPLGTANVLARELGLPLKPEEACERLLSGTAFRMDAGVATDEEGTERRFVCMAGIGFDASFVREVYLQGDQPDLHVVDGVTTRVAQFAVVANGRYYGESSRWPRAFPLRAASLRSS